MEEGVVNVYTPNSVRPTASDKLSCGFSPASGTWTFQCFHFFLLKDSLGNTAAEGGEPVNSEYVESKQHGSKLVRRKQWYVLRNTPDRGTCQTVRCAAVHRWTNWVVLWTQKSKGIASFTARHHHHNDRIILRHQKIVYTSQFLAEALDPI